jgi:hypothetical protein
MLRLWLAMGVGVACLTASGVVASMARAQPSADPIAVITAYEMARNRRDTEAALSYFSDNAVISWRTTFNGKDDIRKFLDSAATRSRFIVISDRKVIGNHVTWNERSGGPTGGDPQPRSPQGFSGAPGSAVSFTSSVEAVVQDGKILSLSYAYGGQVARTDPALDGRAQLPAAFGLAAVVAVLLSVVMIASTGLRRPSPATSSLRGRLMQSLQGWSEARQ